MLEGSRQCRSDCEGETCNNGDDCGSGCCQDLTCGDCPTAVVDVVVVILVVVVDEFLIVVSIYMLVLLQMLSKSTRSDCIVGRQAELTEKLCYFLLINVIYKQ